MANKYSQGFSLVVNKIKKEEEIDDKEYKQYLKNFIFLGQFTQESNKIIVSDPGYLFDPTKDKSKWNSINHLFVFDKVLKGSWNVWAYKDDECIFELVAISCPFDILKYPKATNYHFDNREWETAATVCVDSGQIGIYDFKYYRDDNNLDKYKIWNQIEEDGDKWYAANCYITQKYGADIIHNGCVSKTYMGDGLYNVEILKFENKVAGIRIVFDNIYDSDTDSE